MNKHEIEATIKTNIASMTLSHQKDILPHIFEMLDLKEYYDIFDQFDDSFYMSTSLSQDDEEALCYHNKVHSQAVALNCYEAIYSTNLLMEKDEQRALVLAALYHDAQHLRGEANDYVNVAYAVQALQDAHKNVKYQVSPKILNKALRLINYTEYPYVVMSKHIKDRSALVIRDADLMMSYEPDEVAIDLHIGLFNEFNQKRYFLGEAQMSFESFIENNTKFLQKIEWNTRWARNKAFMHNHPQRTKDLRKKLSEVKMISA
jgi:RecG-like helicase